jgi:hypothetical protein
LAERIAVRAKLCSLCKEGAAVAAAKTAPRAGILFSVGGHHLGLVSASVRVIRRDIKWEGPIEIYCDNEHCKLNCDEHFPLAAKLNVDCVVLKEKFTVRYSSKLLAVLQTKLDHVLMLDADNFLVQSPAMIFNDVKFQKGVSIGWPDLWGSACQATKWPKSPDNPMGVMICGQSSWRDHVLFPVLDLEWKPEWRYTVELTSSIFAINKRTPFATEAWKLAAWMTERPFWTKVLYGDKDTIRLAFLLLEVPFDLVRLIKSCLACVVCICSAHIESGKERERERERASECVCERARARVSLGWDSMILPQTI